MKIGDKVISTTGVDEIVGYVVALSKHRVMVFEDSTGAEHAFFKCELAVVID